MLKLNFIKQAQYLEAKDMEVPFKEGKITYLLNVILDYIREQLESDYFQTILEEQGVINAFASGISIHTSIDSEIQKSALMSLRTHLPLLDVNLKGYRDREIPASYHDLFKKSLIKSDNSLPFLSKITHIDLENYRMVVTWLKGGGIINYEGIEPMARAWLKWKQGNSSPWNKKHVRTFLKNFHKGDIVPIQLLPSTGKNGESRLLLSKIPELEGGIVVLQNGMIKAMVGGFLNRYFNRAVHAKRQLGSIFKPIVYTAALQLNWNSLEPLQNIRDIFEFENTFYLPRPDHMPGSPEVSMEWAGAKSENLATVWLLYHLTDHLNMSEFKEIMNIVGLNRRKDEAYPAYKKRVRDQHGVVVDIETMQKAAFEKSRKDIVSDIIFSGHPEILSNLSRLHYSLDKQKFNLENHDERQILRFSFTRLQALNMRMKNLFQDISEHLEQYRKDMAPETAKALSENLGHFYRTREETDRIIYAEDPALVSTGPLVPITREWIINRPEQFSCGKVWIDGLFDSETLDHLQNNTKVNYMTLFTYKRYDPEVLFWVRDFKTLVNMLYVVHLSKQMGISTSLEPVLSFPLGPNSISISEAALVYQTIMTGQVFPISPDAGLEMVPIIKQIVDREGDVLWEYEPEPVKVLSSRVSGVVTGILRKVMEIGTGTKAKNAVRVFGIPIPSFGKTGTSNRYTNSSFVGFIPGSDKESGRLDILNGYVIASYVGYDDNRPMKAERLAIYGASGALPLWIDTAEAIVSAKNYTQNIQPADLVFDPVSDLLSEYGSFVSVPVSPVSGLPVMRSNGVMSSQLIDIFAFDPLAGEIQ
ncbi:MAG: hypothetical protein JRI74_06280, partial [Deltaproteobacteria bacterium]|nr:hypothetical protein [Deltaproteobacteria bacterium]